MLDKEFRNLVQISELNKAISHSKNKKYYLFKDGIWKYIIIVDSDIKVGGVLECMNDIQCFIFDKFQDKHYISDLFRSPFWKRHLGYVDKMSMYTPEIKCINDFNKKLHLAKILKAEVTNLQEAFEYTCETFGSNEDKYILNDYYENGNALKLLEIDFNNFNSYSEILDAYKV